MRRIAVLAALALIACNTIAGRPSPTPALPTEFVIPTRSPAPSPTPFTGHYGFLLATPPTYTIVREDSATPLGTIDLANIAVSPNGHLVIGWSRTTPPQLRLLDVSAPATARTVLTLQSGEHGGGIAWSVDGSGVLYSFETDLQTEGGVPVHAALRSLDLTTATAAPKDVARFDALQLRPMLWDRLGGDLIAALGLAGGAVREYIVIRGTAKPEERTLPERAWQQTPAISGDGRWVMLASTTEPTLRTFRSDDPGFIIETHGLVADSKASAMGRPSGTQLGVVLDRQLIFWDPQTNTRASVALGQDVFEIVGWRFDGSAAIVKLASGLALVDPSGKTTPLSGDVRFGIALP